MTKTRTRYQSRKRQPRTSVFDNVIDLKTIIKSPISFRKGRAGSTSAPHSIQLGYDYVLLRNRFVSIRPFGE